MRLIRAAFMFFVILNVLTCSGCDWAKAQFGWEDEKERQGADGLWYGGGDPDLERWKKEAEEKPDRRKVVGSSGISARKKGGGKGGTTDGMAGAMGLILMFIGTQVAKAKVSPTLTASKKWRWAALLLGTGLFMCWAGFGYELGQFSWWKILMLAWIPVWGFALTTKTKWDDRFIYGVSMGLFAAAAAGRIVPAFGPGEGWFQTLPTITWGAFQYACVFGVVPGLWEHLGKMNSWAKFLRLAPFWLIILFTQ